MQKEEKIVRGADLATTGQKIKSYVQEQIADKQDTIDTVNVSVDNTTGTPSASASISGGIMNFAFSGIKGETGATGATGATGPEGPVGPQGNTGSSVDYPYELVNNVTTDDATKGLSAAQGVVLDEKISQLGLQVDERLSINVPILESGRRSYSILATGKYGSSTNYVHAAVPVTAGKKYVITAVGTSGARYCFLASLAAPVSGGNIDLVSGTSPVDMTTGQTVVVTIPSGCVALGFHLGTTTNYSFWPQLAEVTTAEEINDNYGQSLPAKFDISDIGNKSAGAFVLKFAVKAGESYTVQMDFDTAVIPQIADFYTCNETGLERTHLMYNLQSGRKYTFTAAADISNFTFYTTGATGTTDLRITLSKSNSKIIPNNSDTISLQLEMGFLRTGSENTGSIIYTANNAINSGNRIWMRTALFLRVHPGDIISSITAEQDDVITLYLYDCSYNYVANLTWAGSPITIPAEIAWIKFNVKNDNVRTSDNLPINLLHSGTIKFAKNALPTNYEAHIVFEVTRPLDNHTQLEGNGYLGNVGRVWDHGVLYLPTSYTRDGRPCPLIIFCHGTGGFDFNSANPAYTDYLNFLTHNGYAVALCSGETAFYRTNIYNNLIDITDSKCNPLLFACYRSLYNYLIRDFNIDDSGVYLLAKSAGGLSASFLAYWQPFKVKATALLAPALVMGGQSFRVTAADQMNFWLARLGYISPSITRYLSDEDRQYILANVANLYGYDPIFLGTTINYRDTLTRMFAISAEGSGTASQNVAAAYAANSELMAIFDNATKELRCPTKIWIAQDDNTVPYMWAEKFVQMVNRGNGWATLRTMPNNTGGHHSVDNATNAPHVNYTCEDGEVADIPVAFAEACDWFKQW